MAHGSRQHSRFAASASHRWMNCHGSTALVATVGKSDVSSSYALDGTEAHELLEYALTNKFRSARDAYVTWGSMWIHRHDSEAERLDAIQVALDYVWEIIDSFHGCQVYIECQFVFPTSSGADAGGTSDVAVYVPELELLYVIDYKHGAGVYVPVVNNEQLMFYAVGVMNELKQKNLRVVEATLVIIQPRAFSPIGAIRSWPVKSEELIAFAWEADNAIDKNLEPGAPLTVGDWCQFCPAAAICPALETKVSRDILPTFNSLAEIRTAGLPDVKTLPPDRLAQIMGAKDFIIEWLNFVEEQARETAKQGVPIPGYKLVYAQSRSKWVDQDVFDMAKQLGNMSGKWDAHFLAPVKLVTITEAKSILKDAYREQGLTAKAAAERANVEIAYLTTKESSGNTTLVPLEDKRPSIDVAGAITYNPVEEPIGA